MKKGFNLTICIMVFVGFISTFLLGLYLNPNIRHVNNVKPNQSNFDSVYVGAEDVVTGASTADKRYKGGSLYIGNKSSYTMSTGSISGSSNYYGGAVYVASGGTFTMTGGTISDCSANYGGAIYVEAGGTLVLKGGVIERNKAKDGPAVYLEYGANITQNSTPATTMRDNKYWIGGLYDISSDEDMVVVGKYTGTDDDFKMHYVYYGSYPQTYVGCEHEDETQDSELIHDLKLLALNQPFIKTYYIPTIAKYWYAYRNPKDNCLYVRGQSKKYNGTNYRGVGDTLGEIIPENGTYVWFRVEPIKWVVMNYDKVKSGEDSYIWLLSYNGLTAGINFNPIEANSSSYPDSVLEKWSNGHFFNTAFSIGEQNSIIIGAHGYKVEQLERYNNAYCFSPTLNTNEKRLCSPTDFALSNESSITYGENYVTADYPVTGGSCSWWLRGGTTGSPPTIFTVYEDGSVKDWNWCISTSRLVRPCIYLSV